MRKEKKIFILLFSLVVLFFICTKKSDAATVLWPIGGSNASETYIEYGYGQRTYSSQDYINKCKTNYNLDVTEGYYYNTENHYGVDIFGIPGHTYSVVAVANGTVVGTSANYASSYVASTNYINRNQRRTSEGLYNGGGYGNFVVIEDSTTKKCYLYGHLNAGTITVKKGDTVKAGQEIAKMGSSGDSGHMHLHFEVRKNLANTFQTPYSAYTYFARTTGYNIQTENPINYIGTTPKKDYVDSKSVKFTHDEAVMYAKYLYRAALGREAATNESEYWANSYESDQSVARITRSIVLSKEGLNKMGELDNKQFIVYVYKMLLLRSSDPSDTEIAETLNNLNNGVWNRNDVITKICNSAEFGYISKWSILTTGDNKAWKPTHEDAVLYVKYLYKATFNRSASDSEAEYWANSYDSDQSIARITKSIIISNEAFDRTGELSNDEFLNLVCDILLKGSQLDDATYNTFLQRLNSSVWNHYDLVTFMCNYGTFVYKSSKQIVNDERQIENSTIDGIASQDKLTQLGDLDADGFIDSSDATTVLELYVANADARKRYAYAYKYADVDGDGSVDACDASYILGYYSACSTAKINSSNYMTITEYIQSLRNR